MAPLAIFIACFLPACERTFRVDARPPSTMGGALGGPSEATPSPIGVTNMQGSSADDGTIDRMASARCTHEQTCGNVGAGQVYGTSDVCLEHMRGSVRDDVEGTSCPYGIDRIALEDCLAAIDAEGCADGLATTHRARKCRADVLCVR